jgi:hypothetical protein
MKKILLFSFLIALTFSQFSCKKTTKNEDPTPFDPNIGALKHGSVSGTIIDTTTHDLPVNFTFNFPYSKNGPNIYDTYYQAVSFGFMQSFDLGIAGDLDYSQGSLDFGQNPDSIRSMPDYYGFSLYATTSIPGGNFFFKSYNINESNSVISNYSYNASTNSVKFTVTTNDDFYDDNGYYPAKVVANFDFPLFTIVGDYNNNL